MFRNITLLSLVIALLSFVAAPVVFAADGASAADVTLETPTATTSTVVAVDSDSLVDRMLGFVIGVFSSTWTDDGNSAESTGTPQERGPSFDPHNRS